MITFKNLNAYFYYQYDELDNGNIKLEEYNFTDGYKIIDEFIFNPYQM